MYLYMQANQLYLYDCICICICVRLNRSTLFGFVLFFAFFGTLALPLFECNSFCSFLEMIVFFFFVIVCHYLCLLLPDFSLFRVGFALLYRCLNIICCYVSRPQRILFQFHFFSRTFRYFFTQFQFLFHFGSFF